MRQAGRYLPEYRALRKKGGKNEGKKETSQEGHQQRKGDDFVAFCRNEPATTEAATQPLRRFPLLDGAILFSDILLIAEALGFSVSYKEGGPSFVRPLAEKDIEELLGRAQNLDPHRYAFATTAAQGLGQRLKRDHQGLPFIGFAGAPWTLACYLLQGGAEKNFPRALAFIRRAPALSKAFLSLLALEAVALLQAQRAGGASALQLFDSWSGILQGQENEQFSLAPAGLVFHELRKAETQAGLSPLPLIFHARGAGVAWQTALTRCFPAQVIPSPDAETDLADLVAVLEEIEGKTKIPIQGNLSPQLLLATRDDAELRAVLKEKARVLRARPWIVNLGAGITPDADPERVASLLQAIKEIDD